MKELEIELSYQELKSNSKLSLAKLVKEKAKNKAFYDLIEKKDSHTKLDDIVYEKYEMQPYLKSQLLYQQDAKILFRLRSIMFNVKRNFSSKYSTNMNCRLCHTEVEDQEHL